MDYKDLRILGPKISLFYGKISPERKGIFLKSNPTKRPKASFEIVYSKSSIIAQIFCHPELKIFESKI